MHLGNAALHASIFLQVHLCKHPGVSTPGFDLKDQTLTNTRFPKPVLVQLTRPGQQVLAVVEPDHMGLVPNLPLSIHTHHQTALLVPRKRLRAQGLPRPGAVLFFTITITAFLTAFLMPGFTMLVFFLSTAFSVYAIFVWSPL